MPTLFAVTLFGAAVLLPFVYRDLPALFRADKEILVLSACSVLIFFAVLLDFEALRKGKLAVVEPLWSFEVPVSGFLAFFVLGERFGWTQILLISTLVVGLFLVSFRRYHKEFFRSLFLEKAVFLAFGGAAMMGAANFFLGWGSRLASPLAANFVLNVFIAAVMGAYLFAAGKMPWFVKDIRRNEALLLSMSIADNSAWIAFAFAMTLVPIAIAAALSESYILVAVILGLTVNKEKTQPHQRIGLVLAFLSAVVLAALAAS